MSLSSFLAFRIQLYDYHIVDEHVRTSGLLLKSFMGVSSFFTALFLFLKKKEMSLIFITVFCTVIFYNIVENYFF